MNQDPAWLNALTTQQAPEVPSQFLRAVHIRRRERRQRLMAQTGLAVILAIAAAGVWIALLPKPLPSPPVVPIASVPVSHSGPPTVHSPGSALTPASLYSGDLTSLDRLASSAPAAPEQIRIGDRWDPDRVKAWVLD